MDKKKFFLIGLAIISFLCFQSLAFGQESLGLSDLQHSLKIRGARWQAGENSMTRLSHEERQKRLGLVRPVHTGKEPMLSLEAQAPLFELPASLDWRNNGGNYVTPIRNQGGCGSCWAFASTAALEANTLISNHTPGTDVNLSEQVMVSCGGAGSCGGGSIDAAATFIKNTGLPLESCYPYTGTNGVCSNACPNWQYNNTYRISNWHYVAINSPTVDALKNALYSYGPLVTTMAVYQDFFSYQTGVYHYISGNLAGYHAVVIVGFDDPGQYFIVKNSWGTSWGEYGYFRIAFSELNSPVGFGDWTIAYEGTAPSCSFSVSPQSFASFASSGGTGSISVTPSTGTCPWTAVSNGSWVQITSGASGTGSGTVGFSVSTNTGTSRTTTLTVAGQTLSVTQASGAAPCTYSLSSAKANFGAGAGSGSVVVTAGSGCPWTAKSNVTWLTTSGSGSGTSTAVFSVTANGSTAPRTGILTIVDKTLTVTQDGAACTATISPSSKSFTATGGSGSVTVTAPTGCSWNVSSNASWIGITGGLSGSGNGTVSYSVTANSGIPSRSGALTIGGNTFAITQTGNSCTYSVSATSLSLGSGARYTNVNVYTSSNCSWTATSGVPWIMITSGASGSGNGVVTFLVGTNTATSSRTGTLTIGGITVTVNQAGGSCTYSVSPVSLPLGAASGKGSVTVSTTSDCAWSASSAASWITITSGATGKGTGTVSFTVTTNTGTSRTGSLTIAGQTVSITQAGSSASCVYFSPTQHTLNASVMGYRFTVSADSSCSWTVTSNTPWIRIISGSSGTGNGTVIYYVDANTSASSRTGTINVGGKTLTVIQNGIAGGSR